MKGVVSKSRVLVVVLLVSFAVEVDARPFRVGMVPNGSVNGCVTCHVGRGGPRNDFGRAVGEFVSPGGREEFWGPALAAMDSDGDGRTNGEELLDAAGAWVSGDPDPGNPARVSNPGFADAMPVPVLSAIGMGCLTLVLLIAGSLVMVRLRKNPVRA